VTAPEIDENYRDAVFPEARWERREFERCDFTEADLRGLVTEGCTFTECNFTRADLGESQHHATAFRQCTFDRTVLGESAFTGCSLLGSMFVDCRLRPWTVREVDLTLVGLSGCDLRKTDMTGLRLREANLIDADLRESDLRNADLTGARLTGAKLTGCDLRGARIDADGYAQAVLRGARVDLEMAVSFAAAHGLIVG
jgi:uncharacterized protein YjbI with pentapeptide repeats